MSTYKTEFTEEYWPTDAEVAAIEAVGLVDDSWHNNASPSWSSGGSDPRVELFVDARDPSDREAPEQPRCTVYHWSRPEGTFESLSAALESLGVAS